jgi:hypothetical protein
MAKETKVQVLVGTRKGGYIVESDRSRKKWKVQGPILPGSDVFHLAADPRNPGHRYALANSPFFGPMVFRSTNFGKKWTEIGTPLLARKKDRPDPFAAMSAGNMPTYAVTNLWHMEAGPEGEPKSLFLGIDPANLFRSDDRGDSWQPLPGLNEHPTRPKWNPGAGGMCLHTILIDPTNPKRMYVGISAAGTFRSDDGGESWAPKNRGVVVSFQPEKRPEVGQCVHHVVMDPANPSVLYRQDHDGIYVSRDAADSWQRVGDKLDHDFGFVAAAPRAAPGNAFFVPLEGRSRTTIEGNLQVWRWREATKSWSPTIRGGILPGNYGTHREGMTADALDPFGLYVGTTTGELVYSSDGAKSWRTVPYRFPSIHSVAVAGPAA